MTDNTRRITTDFLNDPFFIGFDRLKKEMLTSSPNQTNNYPPYNILKTEENLYELQIALAGFSEADLSIQLENGQLSIQGRKEEIEEAKNFIHRGISARAFTRVFTLSESIVVNRASFKDGILIVHLENIIPEEKKPKSIAINSSSELLKG